MHRLLIILCFLCCKVWVHAELNDKDKTHYPLVDDPIDVVIVTHPKDKETLAFCIDGIKENCSQVRRVIVVSAERLTDKAEWFNENRFPFSKDDVALAIARGNKKKGKEFSRRGGRGAGWYFQQLLKLYAPLMIPDVSSNVLVVDADTIFMNPVKFLNDSFGGLFCFSHEVANQRYLNHAARLIPGYQRMYPEVYSVCHHMLFQRAILKDLFRTVEHYHRTEFWVAFCSCVDFKGEQGASEYEIYYNFAFSHTDQVQLRELLWTNSAHLSEREHFKRAGYHFVAFHSYMKGKWPKTFG